MIHEIESVNVTVAMKTKIGLTQNAFVKGMTTPDGYQIDRILYHKHSGQISIEHEGGILQLNENQKEVEIDGNLVRCVIETGVEIKRRPDATPPLKRREPTGFYNPITGESFKVEQAYQQSQTENLKYHSMKKEIITLREYLVESERKNKVLTEKLDSMRKAYHAEADENARLKQKLPVPHESYEIMIDDRGNEIERYETNDIVRLQNRNERLEYSYRESSNLARFYERKLAEEKKVSSYLTEEDRFKAKMSGALISSGAGAIVYTLFNLFL